MHLLEHSMGSEAPRARGMHGARLALLCAMLTLVCTACGGGGGSVPEPDPGPVAPPDGMSGTILLTDVDLGRVVEQEPNDNVTEAARIPPMAARTTLEIAGVVGATAAQFGREDTVDAFRVTFLDAQEIDLELSFAPVGGIADQVNVAVFRTATGEAVAATNDGPSPVTTSFAAQSHEAFDLVVSIVTGHASYVLHVVLNDPAGAPKPVVGSLSAMVAEAVAAPSATPSAAQDPECAGTHILVRLRDGAQVQRVCDAHDLHLIGDTGTGTLKLGFECRDGANGRRKAASLCAEIAADPDVRWAEPDWIVHALADPTDESFPLKWNLQSIGAPGAWAVTQGDPSVTVAVLDSGIVPHPAIANNLVPGRDFISDLGYAADGNGRDPDPTDPGDLSAPSGLSTWHGTHTCGIVGGKTGVACNTSLMMVRVLGVGGGLLSDVAAAILYCAGLAPNELGAFIQPVDIINLSLGITVDSPELEDACSRAANRDVLIVGAAGNTKSGIIYPARYPSVVCVGAIDTRFFTTPYSNFGDEMELVAPGGYMPIDMWGDGWPDGILSSVVDETVFPAVMSQGFLQGTSHAVPHVAGVAALLLAVDPSLSAIDLRQIMRDTARDLGVPGDDPAHGSGLVQAQRAVGSALALLGTPRTDAPALQLPTHSLSFSGGESSIDLPVYNSGGGVLQVVGIPTRTDDGGSWLSATLIPASPGNPDVNVEGVTITVNRQGLAAGTYSGLLRLTNPAAGVLGIVRIVMYVGDLPRAGVDLQVLSIDAVTTIVRSVSAACALRNYRYWLRDLPQGDYHIKAGEDLDGDGFSCEPGERCGWFGGPTAAEAEAIGFIGGQEPVIDLDVLLFSTGP